MAPDAMNFLRSTVRPLKAPEETGWSGVRVIKTKLAVWGAGVEVNWGWENREKVSLNRDNKKLSRAVGCKRMPEISLGSTGRWTQ